MQILRGHEIRAISPEILHIAKADDLRMPRLCHQGNNRLLC